MISICQNSIKILLVSGWALFSVTLSVAHAQESVSLSLSPAIYDMNASPGQNWESVLRITNGNSFDLKVYAETVNFRPAGEDGSARFIPVLKDGSTDQTTLAEWIDVPATGITIPAEKTYEMPLKIVLPDDAPPGGHYAAILIGTRPPDTQADDTRVETSQVVSSLIFLRVAGDIIEQGSIRSFRAERSVVESPKVDFELRFENTGNVHLKPEGEIRIYNMWGQERGVIPINQKTLFGNILSESIRTFRFTWEGEWSPVDIGRYRAEVVLAYGENARKFTNASAGFWIIPWRVLLGITIVLVLIFLVMSWLVKLYIRRMFAVAGFSTESPLQKKLVSERKRAVSVVAPIEVGLLDLRSKLRAQQGGFIKSLSNFVVEYKLFFVGVALMGGIGYLLIWFIFSVSDSDRAFEVTINGRGQQVIVDSESLEYDKIQNESTVVPMRDAPPLRLINRSGVNGTAASIALDLEELGYQIESVSTDLDTVSEQTVIIHDPVFSNQALDLSTILSNALLSPYADDPPVTHMTVYLGQDVTE